MTTISEEVYVSKKYQGCYFSNFMIIIGLPSK